MSITIGHASNGENGARGNSAGDQTGKEVCTRSYYVHSKGWYMLRPKSIEVANALAEAMLQACKNNKIGYDQGNRNGVITQLKKYGSLKAIAVKTECDCSSLVRACCIQAGFDPGNFTTSTEANALEKTGKFFDRVAVTENTVLETGSVLVTKKKGHTVIIVDGVKRATSMTTSSVKEDSTKIDSAKSFDKSLAKSYETTTDLNLRAGAGTDEKKIVVIPGGTKVRCYGYYTEENGTKWLVVQVTVKGVKYTGFCSSKYLR